MKDPIVRFLAGSILALVIGCAEVENVIPQATFTEVPSDTTAVDHNPTLQDTTIVTENPISPDTASQENTVPQDTTTQEAVTPDDTPTFTIPAHAHSATTSAFVAMETERLTFKVLFDSSAIYQTTSAKNQADINKLYGLSDCSSFHQTNSARFGWRWYNNQVELWGYTYANGVRKYAFIAAVPLNEYTTCEIRFEENRYRFVVNETTIDLPRACTGKATGYKLYPYFGGDETAPHEINIRIGDL